MHLKILFVVLWLIGCQACSPFAKTADSQRVVTVGVTELVYQPARMLTEMPLALDIHAPAGWQLKSAGLVGLSMDMPRMPLFFNKNSDSGAAQNQWQTQFLLGACADETMTWRLDVLFINEKGAEQRLSDEFVVFRR
jgi:hypothetical protein